MQNMIKTKRPVKGLWLVLFMLVVSNCLYSTSSYGAKKMERSYLNEKSEFNEAPSLSPQEFPLNGGLLGNGWMAGGYSSISLFPVPQENSVGTNDMFNAITLISFPGKRISYDKNFKNAVDDTRGGSAYLPVISKDVIGFAQTRSFLIYDFKKKIHREFRITMSIAKNIRKAATADARQRLFLFEIEGHSGSSDPWDIASTLELMGLSGEEPKLIKKIPIGKGVVWSVVGDKNFLYDFTEKLLQVYNMNLEPAQHPLADVIKQNKGKIDFTWIHAHPTLPFAILSGGDDGSTIIGWGGGRNTTPLLINSSSEQFSFSPDGKWVTFKKYIDSNTERTYLMPVSEKYPNYLGSPILLVDDYFNDKKSAWTTNPISFVGSSGEKIYRWNLDNQDFPEKGKMSFHDYIVREDLKKLTKEKRQGLGK